MLTHHSSGQAPNKEFYQDIWEVIYDTELRVEIAQKGPAGIKSRRFSHFAGIVLDSAKLCNHDTLRYHILLDTIINVLGVAIHKDPANEVALNLMGSAQYMRYRDDDKALQYYHAAVLIDTSGYYSYKNITIIYLNNRQYDSAVFYANILKHLRLRRFDDHQLLFDVYFYGNETELAAEILYSAVEDFGYDPVVNHWVGLRFGRDLHILDTSVHYLSLALKMHPSPESKHYEDLGVALCIKGDLARGIEVLEKGLQLYPGHEGFLSNLEIARNRLNENKPDDNLDRPRGR